MSTLTKCWASYEREVLPKIVDQVHVERIMERWLEATGGALVGATNWHTLATKRLDRGIKLSTLMREINVLRAVLRHGFKQNIIAKMPALPHYEIRSSAVGLTTRELDEIMKRAMVHSGLDLFVKISLATGARPGAVMGLTWDRVDFERRTIDFDDPSMSKHGRRKKRAIVPMNEDLVALLTKEKRERMPGMNNPVVPWFRLNRVWRRHIGMSRPHALRHTVATEIARRFGLLAAAKMLGHKSIRTTEQVYVHIQADHLRDAAESLSTITRK